MPCRYCHENSGDLDFCSTDCYEEYQSQSVSIAGEHHAHDSTEEGQGTEAVREQPHRPINPSRDASIPF